MELTLLSWRNHFNADVWRKRHGAYRIAVQMGAVDSRCAAACSERPARRGSVTLVQPDPTWEAEYALFQGAVAKAAAATSTTTSGSTRCARRAFADRLRESARNCAASRSDHALLEVSARKAAAGSNARLLGRST